MNTSKSARKALHWKIRDWLSITTVVLGLQFFGVNPTGAAASKFVVGYAAMNTRLAPLWLAEEQGFFNKYGLEHPAGNFKQAPITRAVGKFCCFFVWLKFSASVFAV